MKSVEIMSFCEHDTKVYHILVQLGSLTLATCMSKLVVLVYEEPPPPCTRFVQDKVNTNFSKSHRHRTHQTKAIMQHSTISLLFIWKIIMFCRYLLKIDDLSITVCLNEIFSMTRHFKIIIIHCKTIRLL